MAESQNSYEKVKDLLLPEEFRGRVQAEVEEWGGLLTEKAAALLVVDALGRNEVAFGQISDLYEGGEALLRVTVEHVGPVHRFTRRDGGEGQVVHLTVSDASGTVRLVLRDEETDFVTSGTVREGDHLKVVDGYVRVGREGLEVSAGKWGVVLPEVSPDALEAPRSQFRL
ncbi:MAG: OB-fold nucleic acid binding domain-containing protein [Thermoplasmata archaeon]